MHMPRETAAPGPCVQIPVAWAAASQSNAVPSRLVRLLALWVSYPLGSGAVSISDFQEECWNLSAGRERTLVPGSLFPPTLLGVLVALVGDWLVQMQRVFLGSLNCLPHLPALGHQGESHPGSVVGNSTAGERATQGGVTLLLLLLHSFFQF